MTSIEQSYTGGAKGLSIGKFLNENISDLTKARAKKVGAVFGQALAVLAVLGAIGLTVGAFATHAGAGAIIGCFVVDFAVSACAYALCKYLDKIKKTNENKIEDLEAKDSNKIKTVIIPARIKQS